MYISWAPLHMYAKHYAHQSYLLGTQTNLTFVMLNLFE